MPHTTAEFTIPLSRAKLWLLLNDLERLGKCVPGCEEVQVLSPVDSKWRVKINVGIISRKIQARAHIVERSEPDRILLKIDSGDGDITGAWRLNLSEEAPESTKVTLSADMRARGSFEWIVNQIINTQLSKMVLQFADCVGKSASVNP